MCIIACFHSSPSHFSLTIISILCLTILLICCYDYIPFYHVGLAIDVDYVLYLIRIVDMDVWRDCSYKVAFRYDEVTKRGRLMDLGVDVLVRDTHPSLDSISFDMSIGHQTGLRCFGGGWSDIYKKWLALYEMPTDSLESFLRGKGDSIQLYRMLARHSDGTEVDDQFACKFVNGLYREMIRDIILFVQYIHSVRMHFHKGIDIERNVKVVKGRIKILAEYAPINNDEDIKADYKEIGRLVRVLVEKGHYVKLIEGSLPHELDHLLASLDHFRVGDELLVKYPMCVLSSHQRLALIKNFSSTESLSDRAKFLYWKAASKMERSAYYEPDWQIQFRQADPSLGTALQCFKKHQVPYGNSNESLLSCARNMAEHGYVHMEAVRAVVFLKWCL